MTGCCFGLFVYNPLMETLEIIYQDQYLVVINKPSGLLVHRSLIDRRETRFAIQILRDQIGQYVYPVHRLDKPTSGILVFALSKEIARALSEEILAHGFHKEYLAVIRGYLKEQRGVIDYPLKEVPDKMTDSKADPDKPAQEAVTAYERLSEVELPYAVGRYDSTRYTLVRLTPKTGRKHQLRRHMKHLLHPILGDTKYGRNEHNRFIRSTYDAHRLLLHAQSLRFRHPVTKQQLCFEAALDETWSRVMSEMGLGEPSEYKSGYRGEDGV